MPTTTNYIWDEENLLAETDGSNVVQTVYTNEPQQYGNLVSSRISGATSYHHFDAIGSTRQLTNAAGTVTDTVIYDAWGNVVSRTGATAVAALWIGALGYRYDSDTGLFRVGARTFQSSGARWTSADPLFLEDSRNPYWYANNQPSLLTDASGQFCKPPKPKGCRFTHCTDTLKGKGWVARGNKCKKGKPKDGIKTVNNKPTKVTFCLDCVDKPVSCKAGTDNCDCIPNLRREKGEDIPECICVPPKGMENIEPPGDAELL